MCERNYKVVILANNADGVLKFRIDLIKYLIKNNCRINVVIPYENKYRNEIYELNKVVPVYFLPLKRVSISPTWDFIYSVRLLFFFLKKRPDCILSYTIKPVIIGSIIGRILRIKKRIAVITGLGYVFYTNKAEIKLLRKLITRLYRLSLRSCHYIVFQNNDDFNYFISNKLCNMKQSKIIRGSGIDFSKYNYSDAPIQPVSFLMAARFLREKGILEYLEASKYLSKKYKNVFFYLAGKEDDNPSSFKEDYIKKLAKDSNVYLLGWVNVYEVLKNISVYVLPSYGEGMPRTIIEAMAVGRPVITTKTNGCRETVVQDYNGKMVAAKNVKELIEAMEYFIINKEKILEMGKNSRKLAEAWFDVEKISKEMLNLINN